MNALLASRTTTPVLAKFGRQGHPCNPCMGFRAGPLTYRSLQSGSTGSCCGTLLAAPRSTGAPLGARLLLPAQRSFVLCAARSVEAYLGGCLSRSGGEPPPAAGKRRRLSHPCCPCGRACWLRAELWFCRVLESKSQSRRARWPETYGPDHSNPTPKWWSGRRETSVSHLPSGFPGPRWPAHRSRNSVKRVLCVSW